MNTVLFPVSVASLGRTPPSHDNLGYPGLAVENVAYFACTTLGLPLVALGRGSELVFFLLANQEAVENHLIERLPDLSVEDYSLLVRTTGRTCPPRYDGEPTLISPAVSGTPSPRKFGLWSTGKVPRYGSKPRFGNRMAAAEWRDWCAAGRPRAPDAETTFIVNRALGFSDPGLQFTATYGIARQSRFEKEFAVQQAKAAALEGAGAEAAAALRDPSPILRAAAARLRARSGGQGVNGELTRLLEDQAVMVRVAAADGLALLAEPESVTALGRVLSDADHLVRERAALALGRIGTEAAADLLLPSLGNLGHRARYEALCALAAAGRPRARAAISRALKDSDLHTRIAAAAAIGRSTVSPDDPLFVQTQRDPDPRISRAAAHAREQAADSGTSR